MLSRGTQVGNYIIEEEIGHGGMARLYRVHHAVLQTLHALKVLEPAYREQAELRTRFLSEAMIGAKLRHPNIVRVTDVVSTPEVAGIVMELVSGPNLESYLRSLTTPPPTTAIRALFIPILEALAEAHRKGIVHRDLKPANILLEPAGSGFNPKVTDFGIAKVTDIARELVNKKGSTHADARMGTLAYMSPEQIRRAKEVTICSDVFSLGATLYEIATLRVAFDGDSDYEIMHRIVQGRYIPIEKLANVEPGIAAAISKALQSDPEHRFTTCEQFIQALSRPEAPTEPAPVSLPAVASASPPAVVTPLPVAAPAAAPVVSPSPATALPVSPPAKAPRLRKISRSSGWSVGKPAGLVGTLLGILLIVGIWRHFDRPAFVGKQPPVEAPAMPRRPVRETWSAPTPFSGCLKSRIAQRIAVTCLSAGSPFPSDTELRAWFANVPLQTIEVVLLQRKNGTRLVSFEIWREKWPKWWDSVVGNATGEEVCWLLGKALIELNLGRPLDQRLNQSRTAFEYDIFDVRNTAKYPVDKRIGNLEEALSPAYLQAMQAWLSGTP